MKLKLQEKFIEMENLNILLTIKMLDLKILENFLDTGVGKEGYSIISQGKIDEILSSKPNERRKIIDEASGIAKFKYQKEESLKKLKNTDENLIRIKDILYGLEEKYEFLKAEANKAERGLLLSKELKNNEFSFYMNQKQQEDLKIKKLKEDLNRTNVDIESKRNKYDQTTKNSDNLDNELNNLESELDLNSQNYSKIKEELLKTQYNNDVLNERLKNLNESLKKLEEDIENFDYNKSSIENKLSEINKNIISEESNMERLMHEKNSLKKTLKNQSLNLKVLRKIYLL